MNRVSPPGQPRPLAVAAIVRRLEKVHGPRRWRRGDADGVGELIWTVLSQNTSDRNSAEAFRRLRAALPTWEQVRRAPVARIEKAIRIGGLSRIKARRIKRILDILRERYDRLSLEFLRDAPLADARQALAALPGVGPKTVACVLMFGFNRPVLPVDTHVLRVSLRLGLLPPRTTAERAHDLLQRQVPDHLVYPFHLLLIAHGRRTCRARRPQCADCVLADRCSSARRP